MSGAELVHVTKRFGRQVALDDVTAGFGEAAIVGIVGPNGAGKTTMLRILAGVLEPSSGEIRRPPVDRVSYFGGEHTLPPDVSARRWVAMCSSAAARDTTARRFGVLSRGTRQRIGLEAALLSPDTELLLLDEPWEGLDPDASRWLSDHLLRKRAAGATVVVSSHRMHDLASICDRCEFLGRGRLSPGVDCRADWSHNDRVARLLSGFERTRGQP